VTQHGSRAVLSHTMPCYVLAMCLTEPWYAPDLRIPRDVRSIGVVHKRAFGGYAL